MKRRDFLTTSVQGLASALLLSSCQTRLPRHPYAAAGKGSLYVGITKSTASSVLRILNLNDDTYEDIEIPLSFPHSVFRNPGNPDEVFLFEMLGSAAKVHLKSGEISLIDHRKTQENLFIGHAVHTQSEKGIVSLEFFPSEFRIKARARSEKDLSPLDIDYRNFPVGHHVVRLPGTNILVSSGYSAEKSTNHISFYDFMKQELVNQIQSETRLVHMMPISPSEVIGVSVDNDYDHEGLKRIRTDKSAMENLSLFTSSETRQSPSPMYYANVDGSFRTHWDDTRKDLFISGFGVDRIPGSDYRYVTGHYRSGTVILWRNYAVEKVVRVPFPTNIVASDDGEEILVLSQGKIKVFSAQNLIQVREIAYGSQISFIYG